MKLHFLQHHPEEGLGTIEKWAIDNHFEITNNKLYENEINFPDDFDILIVMGGPQSVYEEEKYGWLVEEKAFIRKTIAQKTPVLGICLGAQLIANALSAEVYPNQEREIGWFPVWFSEQLKSSLKNLKLPHSLEVFHWHGDTFDLPENAIGLGWSEATKNQGFIYEKHVIALQFHLEMSENSINNMSLAFIDELKKTGRYVQTLEELKGNSYNYSSNQNLMFLLLDFLKTQIKTSDQIAI